MGKKAKRHWIIEDQPEGSIAINEWEHWSKSLDLLPESAKETVELCRELADRRIAMLKKLIKEENERN